MSSKKPPIEPAGCAVAIANLVGCRKMSKADEPAARCEIYPNAMAWVLEDVIPIKPFPVKGSLGIYDVEVEDGQLVKRPRTA